MAIEKRARPFGMGYDFIDTRTGKKVSEAEYTNFVSSGLEDYKKQNNITNPFTPGTREHAEFEKQLQRHVLKHAGAPGRPEFGTVRGPDGNIKDIYKLNPYTMKGVSDVGFDSQYGDISNLWDGVNLNTEALEALRGEGLRTESSTWANQQKEKLGLQSMDLLDRNADQMSSANAQAMDSLAMSGGLTSGARTSLAKDMQRGMNQGASSIRRGQMLGDLDIDIQDEGNRLQILQALPGMELQALQPDMTRAQTLGDTLMRENQMNLDRQFRNRANTLDTQRFNAGQKTDARKYNINNAINDQLAENAYDLGAYNEVMKAWAANKQADAQAGAGKK